MAIAVADMYKGGVGFLRISPITMTVTGGTTISAFGTKQDYIIVSKEQNTFGGQPEKENLDLKTTRGKTIRATRKPITISITDGSAISGADDDMISVDISFGYSQEGDLQTIWAAGTPCAVIIGAGLEQDDTVPGFKHLLAYPDGNLDITNQDGIMTTTLNFKGGNIFSAGSTAYTDYNTALTTSLTVAPFGFDSTTEAITISDIATGDYTNLLLGKIVLVDA